jgi:hypothetical protein
MTQQALIRILLHAISSLLQSNINIAHHKPQNQMREEIEATR